LRHSSTHTRSQGAGVNTALAPAQDGENRTGHARISSTAIYADASGDEEAAFALRFWDDL
jgi:hypothetical protein